MKALGDETLDVRLAAALSLARLGCEGAVIPIIRSLDLPGEISQRRIAEILAVLGKEAEQPLLGILNDTSSGAVQLCIAARTSGLLRLRRAATPLERLLEHPEEDVRINAVRTLGSLGDPSCARVISARSDDASWEVRSAAMDALGAFVTWIRFRCSPKHWVIRNGGCAITPPDRSCGWARREPRPFAGPPRSMPTPLHAT